MGNKPLTWQQVLIVLLCLPLLAGLVMAFGGNIEPEGRRIGGYILAVTIPLIAALVVWRGWGSLHGTPRDARVRGWAERAHGALVGRRGEAGVLFPGSRVAAPPAG